MVFICLTPNAHTWAQTSVSNVNGQRIEEIAVFGNQRIETPTIETYLGIKAGQRASRYTIDKGLKELYKTGFFSDVAIEIRGRTLIVTVKENPSINRVAFEGNNDIDDEDLEKEITLRSRAIYTSTAVQNDVKRLLDVYRRNGKYSAIITPKIIQKERNRVDLVFEIEEGPETSIRHISFIGNRAFSSAALEDAINSEEHRWYKFLSGNDKYDPDRLEYDKELLRRFYRSEGYADFQVKSAFAELTPDKDAFYLTFTLDEGPKYTFGKIEIETELPEDKQPALLEFLSTQPEEQFDASEIEGSIDKMVELLGDEGFAFVDIDPILKRRNEDNIIDLTYHIKEGPRVYVERINIFGNMSTLDSVVRREFRLVEGDAYSVSKIRRSEQRLKNLGYFEDVKVNTEEGSSPDKVIVNVEVVEQSTGEISLGAGFSSVDGPLADIGLTERNFLGRGQTLKFHILAAAERQQFDVGFTEPYLFGRDIAGGFDLYKITQDFRQESSFDRDATGGRLRAGYSLGEKLRHNVYYAFEQNEVSNIDADASRFIRDQEGENITSIVGHSLVYDDRDNRFDPRSGWFAQINQDFAGLGGDDKFVRHEVMSEYYIPIAEQWTFMLAGSAGHLAGINEDIRINQRFFVGGRDLRGFDSGGIGPRDITTDDALGGNVYYTASSEIRFPLGLPEDLGFMGAIFLDVGSLWDVDDNGPEVRDSGSLRAAAGFGISWRSPFGPIRIDFAKAFVKEDYDDTESIRFSFG
ncbi:MAG: outer membrane protein assembly factor BamA, partial [Rickettsiales bacterium]|nr:outer membrane protein assembly factor BamA [Rickettsiales bacterium]